MKLLGSMTRYSVQPSMTRYSVQPRDQIFLKGYRFLSFAINVRKIISRNLSSKQSQKLHAKQSATDALKTASKRAIQKNSKSNWRFNWNIADKITRASKTLPQNNSETDEEEILRERYIPPE